MRNKGYKEGWHRVFSCIRAFARQCDAYRRPLGTNVSQLEMAGGLVLKRFIILSGASSRGLPWRTCCRTWGAERRGRVTRGWLSQFRHALGPAFAILTLFGPVATRYVIPNNGLLCYMGPAHSWVHSFVNFSLFLLSVPKVNGFALPKPPCSFVQDTQCSILLYTVIPYLKVVWIYLNARCTALQISAE